MPDNEHELSVTLPQGLRRQFAEVQQRLWRVETTVGVASSIFGLAVAVFALFLSDRFWNTPTALRVVFWVAGVIAVLAGFGYWARRWLWQKRTLVDLAIIVQKRYRRLGDRLLGVVELSQEQRHLSNFSPALYHAAIHQVADEARQYDFRESVSARLAEKFGVCAGVALACWLALAAVLPQASWNAFARWLVPMAKIPRYTLVGLDGLPRELIVPRGEPFVIAGNVQYRSFWKPSRVAGRIFNFPPIQGSVEAGKIRLQIPGQIEKGLLRVQLGDAVAEVEVTPVYRPALRELTARIQLPEYLQYPDVNQILESGTLSTVEGSRVAFDGKITQPLASANMQSDGGARTNLTVNGTEFVTGLLQPRGIASYSFNWTDDRGLSNTSPLRLSVAMQKDAPPAPELSGLPRETAVLVSDVLHVQTEARDDFGVRDLGLTWEVSSDTPLTEGIVSEIKIMTPNSHIKKASKVFLWSPRIFRIPADSTVELQGFARDFYPDRERSRTGVYRIRVLSPEEHAELIRERLEDVMARAEEVTRLQEKIAANMTDVKDSPKLAQSQKASRIGQSKDDQLENSSRLTELSDQAAAAVQEAMKNPVFPAEMIRQWNQSAQQWQKLAQEKMQAAASSMQSAQQGTGSQQQQIEDAAQKAQDILSALERMQDRASRHMDDLQALTLSQRLHKVSTQEKEISAKMFQTAPDTIGLPPQELPDKFKHVEQSLTADQGNAQKESDALQGEISRFFERTQKTNYGAVSKDMKDSHTSDQLGHLGELIGGNVGIEASTGLDNWSKHFQKWSDQLQPPQQNSGSGNGSGGKQKSKDLTEQLIALLRLRENEMNLRDQTTVLNQQKPDAAALKERAASLAGTQKKLGGTLDEIHKQAALPQLETAFEQTAEAMAQVESILNQPEIGKPADDAEVKTVDTMSDLINLINEQAQRGQPQQAQGSGESNTSEEMSFLMRMMQNTANAKAMAMQPASGLNQNGGTTDRAGNPVGGNAKGRGAAARNVKKASGVNETSPVEFRDAMDIYYHGIEQNKE